MSVKVGDLIYFENRYGTEQILPVERITAGGTIVTSEYRLDEQLRVKGKRERWDTRPYYGRVIGEKEAAVIRQQWADKREAADIAFRLSSVNWHNLALDKLRKVKAVFEEAAR